MLRLIQLYVYFVIILLFVSASKGHHQADIYKQKKTQNTEAYSTKTSILWDPIYNYYQPLDVISVVSCVIYTSYGI